MRRALSLLAVLGALLLVAVGSPATAAEAHHGTFSSGAGYNNGTGLEGYVAGSYDLAPEGTWNLVVGANSVQVTGVLKNPTCPLAPCGFTLNLSAGTPWVLSETGTGYSTFESFVDWGVVQFDMSFTYEDTGAATLELDITGCPHGWTDWDITA